MKKYLLGILGLFAFIATLAYGADIFNSVKFDSNYNLMVVNTKGDGTNYLLSGKGITNGKTACKGCIGEIITSSVASFTTWATTAGQYGDIITLPLTAGVWLINGNIVINNNGAVTAQVMRAGIGATTGDVGPTEGNEVDIYNIGTTGYRYTMQTMTTLINISGAGTINYYLKGRADSTITNIQYTASAYAVRVR